MDVSTPTPHLWAHPSLEMIPLSPDDVEFVLEHQRHTVSFPRAKDIATRLLLLLGGEFTSPQICAKFLPAERRYVAALIAALARAAYLVEAESGETAVEELTEEWRTGRMAFTWDTAWGPSDQLGDCLSAQPPNLDARMNSYNPNDVEPRIARAGGQLAASLEKLLGQKATRGDHQIPAPRWAQVTCISESRVATHRVREASTVGVGVLTADLSPEGIEIGIPRDLADVGTPFSPIGMPMQVQIDTKSVFAATCAFRFHGCHRKFLAFGQTLAGANARAMFGAAAHLWVHSRLQEFDVAQPCSHTRIGVGANGASARASLWAACGEFLEGGRLEAASWRPVSLAELLDCVGASQRSLQELEWLLTRPSCPKWNFESYSASASLFRAVDGTAEPIYLWSGNFLQSLYAAIFAKDQFGDSNLAPDDMVLTSSAMPAHCPGCVLGSLSEVYGAKSPALAMTLRD
ncbi:hypothetical protein GCM10009638_02780 [Luteococcus sanguinis]